MKRPSIGVLVMLGTFVLAAAPPRAQRTPGAAQRLAGAWERRG